MSKKADFEVKVQELQKENKNLREKVDEAAHLKAEKEQALKEMFKLKKELKDEEQKSQGLQEQLAAAKEEVAQ